MARTCKARSARRACEGEKPRRKSIAPAVLGGDGGAGDDDDYADDYGVDMCDTVCTHHLSPVSLSILYFFFSFSPTPNAQTIHFLTHKGNNDDDANHSIDTQ